MGGKIRNVPVSRIGEISKPIFNYPNKTNYLEFDD